MEKFIGDAVMAVWGAPIAREDDAERAVRAALDLVDAVRVLGPGVDARAAVLTGEAAVTVGAVNRAWSPGTWSTPPAGSSRSRRSGACWSARPTYG